jgi:hypothetical protein
MEVESRGFGTAGGVVGQSALRVTSVFHHDLYDFVKASNPLGFVFSKDRAPQGSFLMRIVEDLEQPRRPAGQLGLRVRSVFPCDLHDFVKACHGLPTFSGVL